MAPCMVEIQDNNDLGSIRIAVTSKEEQLNRANYDVYTHFAREKEFRAKTVVVVSWDGLLSQVCSSSSLFKTKVAKCLK